MEPATFTTTTTTQTAAVTGSLAAWLETKQCMLAKPELCLRPLGCSHRSSPAPPCAAHLLKDSFHRNPTACQVNRLHKQLSRMKHNLHLLNPLVPLTQQWQFISSSNPFTGFTCLFHSFCLSSGISVDLHPSNPFTHSFNLLLFVL